LVIAHNLVIDFQVTRMLEIHSGVGLLVDPALSKTNVGQQDPAASEFPAYLQERLQASGMTTSNRQMAVPTVAESPSDSFFMEDGGKGLPFPWQKDVSGDGTALEDFRLVQDQEDAPVYKTSDLSPAQDPAIAGSFSMEDGGKGLPFSLGQDGGVTGPTVLDSAEEPLDQTIMLFDAKGQRTGKRTKDSAEVEEGTPLALGNVIDSLPIMTIFAERDVTPPVVENSAADGVLPEQALFGTVRTGVSLQANEPLMSGALGSVEDAIVADIPKGEQAFLMQLEGLQGATSGKPDFSSAVLQDLAQNGNVNSGPASGPTVHAGSTPTFLKETAPIQVPLRHEQWGQDLASKVVWQVGENIQQARIQLHPSEWGPIEVLVKMQDEQATVHFHVKHALVEEAIHEAIPQLRDMLSQSGVNLLDANVSQGNSGQGWQPKEGGAFPSNQPEENGSDYDGQVSNHIIYKENVGLIDAYA
jgi:flagellar hook-length control protein FliK